MRWSCLLALFAVLHAQEIALAGQVVDAAGSPMDGVLVRLLGSGLTAVTGKDGRWTIAEGTPRAIFPERVKSASTIAWNGPGSDLQVGIRARTGMTVLSFAADGTQLGKQQFDCGASGAFRLDVPQSAVLVGIESQACDRVVYALGGGRAALTFSTCAGAAMAPGKGLKDIVSCELPGHLPARVQISTLVEPEALAKPMRLLAIAGTIPADPATLPGLVPRLKGGETVLLASGDYGSFELRGASGYAWWVTFKAAPGAKPVFERISFPGGSEHPDGEFDQWVCFDGVTVEDGVSMRGARWVDIRNSTIRRRGEIIGSLQNVEKAGIGFRQTSHLRIDGCEVTHAGNGISGTGNHIIYRRNHIHHCGQDGMHFLGGHDFLCEYNEVHDFDDGVSDAEKGSKPWNMHSDCLQMYPIWGADEPANWLADCTMRGNRFYRPESLGWMIQSKRQDQLKRFLFENNITCAAPGYMFHMKDSCEGVVLRFNSFLIPEAGFQWEGATGRRFSTARANSMVAVPSWCQGTTWVEVYGNIMGGRNEIAGAKLARCDNNLYYGAGPGRDGPGERHVSAPPFVDVTALDAIPTGPAVGAVLELPPQPGDRHQVPLPAYDANGNPRGPRVCLGAVDPNAKSPSSGQGARIAKVSRRPAIPEVQAPVAVPPSATGSQPVAIPPGLRSTWNRHLQEAIRRSLAGPVPPGFVSSLTGGEAVVEAVTEDGALAVRLSGMGAMSVAWNRLTPGELAGLADTCGGSADERLLLRGCFHLFAGRVDAARRLLAQAGDPGAEVLRVCAVR